MPWRKITADKFVREEWDVKESVNLPKLEARLARLKTLTEPTETGKIVWAKKHHPTFEEMMFAKAEFLRLKALADGITDDELKVFCEEMHPYYTAQDEITILKALIATLEDL